MSLFKSFEDFYSEWSRRSRNIIRLQMVADFINYMLLSVSLSLVLVFLSESLMIGCVQLVINLYLIYNAIYFHQEKVASLNSLQVAIDIKNPDIKSNIYFSKSASNEVQPLLSAEINELNAKTKLVAKRFLLLLTTLIPITACLVFINLNQIKKDTNAIVTSAFSKDTELNLEVIKGHKTGETVKHALKDGNLVSVDLIDNNSVKILGTLSAKDVKNKTKLVLYKTSPERKLGEVLYEFTLKPFGKDNNKVDIEFTVPQSAALVYPEYSTTSPIVIFSVEKLPIPEISLTWVNKGQMTTDNTWVDDNELEFSITAKGYQPLDKIELDILIDGKKHTELVSRIINSDKTTITTEYRALLEKYLEQDYANISLYAKATDRSTPLPLQGISNEIQIKVESAYGRYLSSLEALKQASQGLSDLETNWDEEKYTKVAGSLQSSFERSMDSPFFDFLDRSKLNEFNSTISDTSALKKKNVIHALKLEVVDFLEEHQSINDRERDRDFFVAIRTLSRLLDTDKEEQLTNVTSIISSLHRFLKDRKYRWKKRVDALPSQYKPNSYANYISASAFISDLNKISTKDTPAIKDSNMKLTMKLTREYKEWIESLEEAEDKFREDRKSKQEQSLAESQQIIRQLRERQEKISSTLDFASKKKKEELSQKWFETRIEQNTNIKKTKQVSAQAKSQSPKVYEKLMLALEYMNNTNKSGNEENFVAAESNSDQAGRSLRLADQAASEQRQNMQQSGKNRRRRRTTGDSYFGSNFVESSIEIQRSYEVDKRYRGDILDQILEMPTNQKQEAILDSYLKEITR